MPCGVGLRLHKRKDQTYRILLSPIENSFYGVNLKAIISANNDPNKHHPLGGFLIKKSICDRFKIIYDITSEKFFNPTHTNALKNKFAAI